MDNKNVTSRETEQTNSTFQKGHSVTITMDGSDIGRAIWLVPIYVFAYSIFAFWLLIDGWLTGFSSLLKLWDVSQNSKIPAQVPFLFFTMLGSLLGCAILGITSFHRHYAINRSFNRRHIWGFFLAPLLAATVGCLIFAIIQSGLLVLTGDIANEEDPVRATLGYVTIGGVAGYNWDVFVKKLENLSQDLFHSNNIPD